MNLQRAFSTFLFLAFSVPVLAGFWLASGVAASAQGTHLWTQSRFEEFEKGTPQGVEITSDGKLRRAPVATEMLTTPSTFVWSVAADPKKPEIAYLGTGSPAAVLRVDLANAGKAVNLATQSTKLFETKALAVEVVRLGPDGAVYAATIPDGKVYRLKSDATSPVDETTAELIFDLAKAQEAAEAGKTNAAQSGAGKSASDKAAFEKTGPVKTPENKNSENKNSENKARYIWDMTFDPAGRLYIATGGPGTIYRLDVTRPKAEPEIFFQSDEQHIRTLAWEHPAKDAKSSKDAQNPNLLAGSDGSGLVYRITPEGKAYVLFSAPRREVTALAVGADGTIYEADVGDKSHNPLPQLPVQAGGSSITISFVSPGSVQAANASTALPEGTEIFALTPDAAPRKLWSGKDEVVYALTPIPAGVTAFTGNRGRILSIHNDGTFSDIAHLDAQQAVAVAALSASWLVATANTGKLFRLDADALQDTQPDTNPEAHTYASDVFDAGAVARWGRVEIDPDSHGYQIFTRSGNVEQPVRQAKDWGWSDWQPVAGGKIASPSGRYFQWKVALSPNAEVAGVGINYLAINAAPAVDDVLVVPGARFVPQPPSSQPPSVTIAFPNGGQNGGVVFDPNAINATAPIQAQKDKTAVTVRWNAHDDNGDELSYDLFLRGDGEHLWRPLKKGLTERVFTFDGSTLPDGGYAIRVVASDAPSHTPGDALTGELVSERFELDNTAPVISALKAEPASDRKISVSFNAKDAASPISHAEYSIDAGKWQYVEPLGQLSDDREERYSITVPIPDAMRETDSKPAVPEPTEHLITVRVYDRHENMATAKVVVPINGAMPAKLNSTKK